MDFKHLEPRLRLKEHEVLSTLAALEGDARTAGNMEVHDGTDHATVSQNASSSLDVAAVLSLTLQEVQDALGRLKNGDFGNCTLCGRPIEPTRMEAVPWTPYCLEDQEKQDLKMHPDGSAHPNSL
jgi:DnaK suppressor protein